jgi:hypothetical protein
MTAADRPREIRVTKMNERRSKAPTINNAPALPSACCRTAAKNPPIQPPARVIECSGGGGTASASRTATQRTITKLPVPRAIDSSLLAWRNSAKATSSRRSGTR